MKKHKVLDSIRTARLTHVQWVDRVRVLIEGLNLTKEQIPLEATCCDFGRWFYGEGQLLLALFNGASIKKLEDKHKELHNVYIKIFKIHFDTSTQSFFEKLLQKRKKISEKEKIIAMEALVKLEEVSAELIAYLNIFEKNLNSIEEDEFEKLY